MLPINLSELSAVHIQALIDNEVAESVRLEYKSELPDGSTDAKREFLYDVAALANRNGGDLIYGIVDRRGEDNQSTGIADRLSGIRIANIQTESARLSSIIRDSISPRVSGVAMESVSCDGGDVIVVRVPESWNKPHMVTFSGVNKFFGRSPTGKYPMSVEEIGRAFSQQRELREEVAHWRAHRADLANRDMGPAPRPSPVIMLFHFIPIAAFQGGVLQQTWTVPNDEKHKIYVPHHATNFRYNADGYLASSQIGPEPTAYGYTQLFRSGIVEYADSHCFSPQAGASEPLILVEEVEKQIVRCYQDATNRTRKLGLTGSAYVGFSFVGIEDRAFYTTMMRLATKNLVRARQNIFSSPETFVDLNDEEVPPYSRTLLPLVNTMWQAAGLEETPFMDGEVWRPLT